MDTTDAIQLLTELTYQQELTNTILLFFVGTLGAIGVCVLLYKFIRLFY